MARLPLLVYVPPESETILQMKLRRFILTVLLVAGFAAVADAGDPQRIGHTTLTPRHSSPDDKGMYSAAIDPVNGYAYFIGDYLFKLDLTGDLPVQVGPSLYSGQAIYSAIDVAAGQLYLCKATLDRYAVNGTNALTTNGSLTLATGNASEILIDDSDANPANHYGYVLCTKSGSPATVVKVALGPFTNVSSVTLAASESNFLFAAAADVRKGYGYYVSAPSGGAASVPIVVKIKFTPGYNAPVRIGAVSFGTLGDFVDGGAIDTVHGYAYYGTYGNTNLPARIYKIKLEAGDVPPTLVGAVELPANEGRLSASVCDPTNGFVYFADDNTYPGHLYQFALNGTNPPLEIARYAMQSTTNAHPPDGTTTNNTTTNLDGGLPFGEVFFRSAVFDPLHGCAYLGQDSRPNQVVKVQLAKIDPFTLASTQTQDGSFQLSFTNITGGSFNVLSATNISLPLSNWSALGSVTDSPPGQFQFTDPSATSSGQRFYRVGSQ